MKLISSLIRPDRLDAVRRGLKGMNVCALTVVEVKDHSPQDHGTTVWKGRAFSVEASLKMEIQVVVHDDDVDRVIDLIMSTARTGIAGDGHVCVMPVEHRYDIRTGLREVS